MMAQLEKRIRLPHWLAAQSADSAAMTRSHLPFILMLSAARYGVFACQFMLGLMAFGFIGFPEMIGAVALGVLGKHDHSDRRLGRNGHSRSADSLGDSAPTGNGYSPHCRNVCHLDAEPGIARLVRSDHRHLINECFP